jgi:hypothetical protein
MSGGHRKRSALSDNGEGEDEGGQVVEISWAKRPKVDAADAATAYAAAIQLVKDGELCPDFWNDNLCVCAWV